MSTKGKINWGATFIRITWAFAGAFFTSFSTALMAVPESKQSFGILISLISSASWAALRMTMLVAAQITSEYEAQP